MLLITSLGSEKQPQVMPRKGKRNNTKGMWEHTVEKSYKREGDLFLEKILMCNNTCRTISKKTLREFVNNTKLQDNKLFSARIKSSYRYLEILF